MVAKLGIVNDKQLSDKLTEIISVANVKLSEVVQCDEKQHEHKVSLGRAVTTTAVAVLLASMLATGVASKRLDNNKMEDRNIPLRIVQVDEYDKDYATDLKEMIRDIGITADLNKGSMLEAFQECELSGNGRSTQEERQKIEDERSSYSAKKENLDTLFDQLENDYKSGGISSQEYFLGVLKLSSVACSDLSSANRAYVASLGEEARWVEVHRDYYISKGFDPAQHDQQLEDVGEKSDESVSFAENYQEQARFYGELFEELNAMNSRGEHIDEAVVQRVIKELQERHDSGLDQKAIKASTQSNSGNDERE